MRARVVALVLSLVAGAAAATAPGRAPAVAALPGGDGELHAVTPARLLDTRSGDPVGPGGTVQVDVAGRGGVPATGVLAVALDLTATRGTAATSVTAYPSGTPRPRATALYAAPREAATAGVVVPVGPDGRVTLHNEAGSVDLTADVTGWYGTAAAPQGLRFHPFAPQPAFDTRTTAKPLTEGETRAFEIPHELVQRFPGTAVLLRVTVPSATAPTRLTVFQAGTERPGTTSLSAPAGRVSSALVTVPLASNDVSVWNEAGSAHVIVHVVGLADTGANGDDGRYRPLPVAARLADTRNGTNVRVGPLASGGALSLPVAGRAGVPHDATAALLTVGAVRPSATGALTVHPEGSEAQGAQQVGYAAARPAASLVVAKLGPGGRATVRASAGPVHVVVDVHGWYTGSGDYVPMPGRDTAGGIVVDRESRFAYAGNAAKDRVEVVDLSSGTLLAPIPVGTDPAGLDLTPDGRTLYVTNRGSNDISVVDVATRRELRRIPTGRTFAPTDIAIGAHGTAVVYARHGMPESVLLLRLADDLVHGRGAPAVSGEGSLATSRDRGYVAIGHAGSTPADLNLYESATGSLSRPATRLGSGTARVAASSDGTLLVGGPYLVDRVTREVRELPALNGGQLTGAAFSPDDELLYLVCGGRVTAYATSDLAERGSFVYAGGIQHDYVRASGVAAGTPDGSRVLVVTTGGLALVPVGAPYA